MLFTVVYLHITACIYIAPVSNNTVPIDGANNYSNISEYFLQVAFRGLLNLGTTAYENPHPNHNKDAC